MARPFDNTDIKRVIDQHRKLLEELSQAEKTLDSFRLMVAKTSDELIAQEVLHILKDIPIEELNRQKRGFRLKLLKDHGYQSIADLSSASVYSLSSINGISKDAAYAIKNTVDEITATARQGTKIKLSEDKKSPITALFFSHCTFQLLCFLPPLASVLQPGCACRKLY